MERSRGASRAGTGWFAVLAMAVLAMAVVLVAVRAFGGEPVRQLAPGSEAFFDLAGGGQVSAVVNLPFGSWRIAVEQLGVDVEVSLGSSGGAAPWIVDRPLDRDGAEILIVEPEIDSRYTLTIRGRSAAAPAGRVRIVIERLGGRSERARSRLRAERAEMSAASAYARGSADGWRQALLGYVSARAEWRLSGDRFREALAVYSIGVLHRLLRDTRPAIEPIEQAAAMFAELDEPRWQASALNELGLGRITLGELEAADRFFVRALSLLDTAPDPFRRAHACSNRCLISLHRSALREGIACYEACQPVYDQARDLQAEAVAKTNAGRAHDVLGEPDRALAAYEQALALQRQSGELRGEALTLNNLAFLKQAQGETHAALSLYERAEAIYRRLEDDQGRARVLNNRGFALMDLGEVARARSLFEGALALRRSVADKDGEAFTLTNLARTYSLEGDSAAALDHFRQALDLRREMNDRRGEGLVLYRLGLERLTRREVGVAEILLGQAETVFRRLEDRGNLAGTLLERGRALQLTGSIDGAAERVEESLALYRSTRNRAGEAAALHELARIHHRRGHHDEAGRLVAGAIGIVESLRTQIEGPELRAAFLASQRAAHELQVDLLMERHAVSPGTGHDRAALAQSERARARSFLDQLGEAAAGIRPQVAEELLQRRRSAQYRLGRADRQRRRLAEGPISDETASLDLEIAQLLAELDRIDAEVRQASPADSALLRPRPLDTGEMQSMLDQETLLLVYFLGAERSYLWLVSSRAVASFVLPPRSVIDAAARRVYAGLSILDASKGREEAAAAAALSSMVLGPLAGQSLTKRLVVVADGALQYIPFAALPRPERGPEGGRREPMIVRHEIVHLPSASALAAQRQFRGARQPGRRRAAVFADPVFSFDDPRVAGAKDSALSSASNGADLALSDSTTNGETREAEFGRLDRLMSSGREAQSIAALAPPGEVTLEVGFDAVRAAVVRERLGQFRIIHFATHGLVDDHMPRLSGLALSQVDRKGQPIEGFLLLGDIANMELNADLVVLSGCRTALGREIRGEGLIGLTRAFMYAGSERVVASLWQVSDRATSELMERFYRAMWVDGERPAAALRTAQLAMLGDRRRRDPYYWSSFVLQGEWR